ncbi:hypothetical protein BDF20DRAFT_916038 [Mycotypha africana]|uniref:uncharacterized protein n=1 Tax=Mycotypha africana TaxID=64632 RepID=UPI00230094E8|nr:uncharacterized protein BDF20DRAFT_916038 [Mycotypha africana]KAI8970192.1 hypothetical protein BDF20DRAFT_916038 [Mycotypha africana]
MRRKPSLTKSATAHVVANSRSSNKSRSSISCTINNAESADSYEYKPQQSNSTPTMPILADDRESMMNNGSQLFLLDSTPSTSTSTGSLFLYDSMVCRCCGRQDCDNLEYYNRKIRKLESDTRLAAEIGQGLLQKHETYVNEANQQKAQLQQQLNDCHKRLLELEQSLDDVESSKEEITKEKNKWLWEYQKLQKILDETIADLEMANDKCNQFSNDIQAKNAELEKLRIYKFMARHSESREETLTAKLEDTNQELAIRRKNELILEAKVKKLKARYETLNADHEKLTKQMKQRITNTHGVLNGKSDGNVNMNGNDEVKYLPSTNQTSNNNSNTNDFIHLIKELSAVNSKLKTDLMNCKEQLSEAQEEIVALTLEKRLQEDLILSPSSSTSSSNIRPTTDTVPNTLINNSSNKSSRKTESETISDLFAFRGNENKNSDDSNSEVKRATSVSKGNPTHRKQSNNETFMRTPDQPIRRPTSSASMPTTTVLKPSLSTSPLVTTSKDGQNAIVHHHHYHYYVNNKEDEEQPPDYTIQQQQQQQQEANQREGYRMVSAPTMSFGSKGNTTPEEVTALCTPSLAKSPYTKLHEHVSQLLDRLRGSDIRVLNRRLKRAFDIKELSSMSNSIIENLLVDIDTLESRFLWLKPSVVSSELTAFTTADSNSDDCHNNVNKQQQIEPQQFDSQEEHMAAFFSFLTLVKDMLRELGVLKTTMNDLQVVYVQKVEEDELRVQEEIIKKRQLKRRETLNMPSLSKSASTVTVSSTSSTKTARPLSWFTNMFSKSSLVHDDDISCCSSNRSDFTRVSHSVHSPQLLPQGPTAYSQIPQHCPSQVPEYTLTTSNATGIAINNQNSESMTRSVTSDTTSIVTNTRNNNNMRFIPEKSSPKSAMTTTIESIYHTSFSRSTHSQQRKDTNKRRSLTSFFSSSTIAAANTSTPSRTSSLSALSASLLPQSSPSSTGPKRKDIPSTFETDYKSFESPIPTKDHSSWKVMSFTPKWLTNNSNAESSNNNISDAK